MSLHIDYDYLFALRLQLQDEFENESDIIIELKYELLNKGVQEDEIVNTLYMFYELYGITMSKETITQVLKENNKFNHSNNLHHSAANLNQFINIINSQLISGLAPFIIPPIHTSNQNEESKNQEPNEESKNQDTNDEENQEANDEENQEANYDENQEANGQNVQQQEINEHDNEENTESKNEDDTIEEEDDMPPLIPQIEPTIQIIESPGMVQIAFSINSQIQQIANSIHSGLGANILHSGLGANIIHSGLGANILHQFGGGLGHMPLDLNSGGQSLEVMLNSLAPPVVSTLNEDDFQKIKKYKAETKLQENCSICMCSMDENEELCELICTHHFHNVCIETWLKKYNYKCPVCRTELGKTNNNN